MGDISKGVASHFSSLKNGNKSSFTLITRYLCELVGTAPGNLLEEELALLLMC
jgi:hypothetical protein